MICRVRVLATLCSLGGALSAQEAPNPWPDEVIGTWAVIRGIDKPGDPADTGVFVFQKGGRIRTQSIRVKPNLAGPSADRSPVDTLARWQVQWSAEFRRRILCLQVDAGREPVCEAYTTVTDTAFVWGDIIFRRRKSH